MKLALFDIDGTLVDAGGSGRLALCRAFEKVFGVRGMEALAADVPFDGATDTWILSAFAERAGVEEARFQGCRLEFEPVYLELLRGILAGEIRPRVLPGVVALLEALHGAGVHLGLVTGNIRSGARVKLGAAGLDPWFREGAFGDDSAERADLARIARERFESLAGEPIPPALTLHVGDSRQDVRAARANGYLSLAVGTGWTSLEDLEAEGPGLALPDLGATAEILAWLRRAA